MGEQGVGLCASGAQAIDYSCSVGRCPTLLIAALSELFPVVLYIPSGMKYW